VLKLVKCDIPVPVKDAVRVGFDILLDVTVSVPSTIPPVVGAKLR
jgi:hypothetical protein